MTRPPRKTRLLVYERDGYQCAACATQHWLQVPHRRIKGMGGDKRDHTDCPCNLVTLCLGCHQDAHDDRLWAEEQGYVVSRETPLPAEHGIMRHGGSGGVTSWPDCQGGWAA